MVKNLPAVQETQVRSLVGEIPWRREWQPIPVFFGKSHEQRSLVGYSPSQTEHKHTHSGDGHLPLVGFLHRLNEMVQVKL